MLSQADFINVIETRHGKAAESITMMYADGQETTEIVFQSMMIKSW